MQGEDRKSTSIALLCSIMQNMMISISISHLMWNYTYESWYSRYLSYFYTLFYFFFAHRYIYFNIYFNIYCSIYFSLFRIEEYIFTLLVSMPNCHVSLSVKTVLELYFHPIAILWNMKIARRRISRKRVYPGGNIVNNKLFLKFILFQPLFSTSRASMITN